MIASSGTIIATIISSAAAAAALLTHGPSRTARHVTPMIRLKTAVLSV